MLYTYEIFNKIGFNQNFLIKSNDSKYLFSILIHGLIHGLVSKKMHRIIRFNQKACLKPYNDLNTDLKKAKNDFFKKKLHCCFWKNHGKWEKRQRYQACND